MEHAKIDMESALVVVPCLNEENSIADVIRSVLHDPGAHNILLVVADGGSSDRTREIVSRIAVTERNVQLIDNPRRIQSAAINLAVKLFGKGRRWLIRIDAHARYPADYISCLIAEARRTHAASVVVAMNSQGKNCFQKAAAIAQNTLLGAGGSAHRMGGKEGFVDHDHHALFDMNAFRALHGYDEQQSHNEDAEFDVRLTRAGGRIWLTRATSLIYYPRSSIAALYRQYRNYGRGRAQTILRHRVRPKIRQLLPAAVAPAVALALATPLFLAAALPALAWICACLSYSCALGVRYGGRCAFASAVPAMVMHFAWSVGFWQGLFERATVANWRMQPQ